MSKEPAPKKSQQNQTTQQIKNLRARLSQLRIERQSIILEKGLLAQDNKDLRENSAYIHYEQKEHAISTRIHAIMEEIHRLSLQNLNRKKAK